MECFEVDIDLGDELEIEINFEGSTTYLDCPLIDEIDGGDPDSDDPGSANPFEPINGLLDGGTP